MRLSCQSVISEWLFTLTLLSLIFVFSLGIAPHPEYKLSLSGCTMRKELMRQTKHGAQVLLQGE